MIDELEKKIISRNNALRSLKMFLFDRPRADTFSKNKHKKYVKRNEERISFNNSL